MKELRTRWLILMCLALAASWLYSCSDDSCVLPVKVCPDPTKALLGTWVVFESWMGQNPDQMFLDMEMEFRDDDTLMAYARGDTVPQYWMANDSTIFLNSTEGSNNMLLFHYEFEADTLNMWEKLTDLDIYWRLHRK